MLTRLGRPLTLGLLLFGVQRAPASEVLARACFTTLPSDAPERATPDALLVQPFARKMNAIGRVVGVDPALLRVVVMQESSGNPNAVSEVGAVGLTQLMPVAIRQYARKAARLLGRPADARRALDNLVMGALYYRDALRRMHGNVEAAARLYYGGPNPAMHGPRTWAYGKAVAWRYRQMTIAWSAPAACPPHRLRRSQLTA
jgi:soluble lytic murein transglycosylase-like protein